MAERAIDRLDGDLRLELDNLAASWAMEGQELSAQELEVLARYLLGEIDAAERDRLIHTVS